VYLLGGSDLILTDDGVVLIVVHVVRDAVESVDYVAHLDSQEQDVGELVGEVVPSDGALRLTVAEIFWDHLNCYILYL
jgi:hypothetical protein